MAIVYWLSGLAVMLRDQWDVYFILALVFGSTIIGYAVDQEKSRRLSVLVTSSLHALAHVIVVVLSAQAFAAWNLANPILPGQWYSIWVWLGTVLIQMGTVGLVAGSTLFGLNMGFTSLFFRMNRNDSFSSFRHGGYNNFLRIRIKGDLAEVYAVGLEKVPSRNEWQANPKSKVGSDGRRTPDEPVFIPEKPLRPHLIEKVTVTGTAPIEVNASPL
jgi:hypothetical protein